MVAEEFQNREEFTTCLLAMRSQEVRYFGYNPYLGFVQDRRELVMWIIQTIEKFKMHKTTAHVATHLLDRFFQNAESFPKAQYHLIAICCVLLATKYDDIEVNVPSLAAMNEWAGTDYSVKVIRRTELFILQMLGWGLTTVTPLHFLEHYVRTGVVFIGDVLPYQRPSWLLGASSNVFQNLVQCMTLFADLCLQDYTFKQYRPSLLAAAILKLSRQVMHMSPLWSPEFRYLTGYCEEEIAPCYESLVYFIQYHLNPVPTYYSHHQPSPCFLLPMDVLGTGMMQSAYGGV